MRTSLYETTRIPSLRFTSDSDLWESGGRKRYTLFSREGSSLGGFSGINPYWDQWAHDKENGYPVNLHAFLLTGSTTPLSYFLLFLYMVETTHVEFTHHNPPFYWRYFPQTTSHNYRTRRLEAVPPRNSPFSGKVVNKPVYRQTTYIWSQNFLQT